MKRMAFLLIPLIAMIPILIAGCDSSEPAMAAAPPGPSIPVEPQPTPPVDDAQGPIQTAPPVDILPEPTAPPTPTATPTQLTKAENGGAEPLAYDMFMRIEGIPGESTDAGHKDWIELLSYDQRITGTQPPDPLRSGHPEFGKFIITKRIDKASPKLAEAVCKGTHIPAVTLELCRGSGETKEVYMRYRLRDVVIMKVYDKSSPMLFMSMPETIEAYDKASPILFAASPQPIEEVSFVYSKIEWTYFTGGDGPGAEVSAGWDIVKNQPQ